MAVGGWSCNITQRDPTSRHQWSGCSVRIGLWLCLLPTTFIAHCPHWSHLMHSGPPMYSGLFPSRNGLGCARRDSIGSGVHPDQGSLLHRVLFSRPRSALPGPGRGGATPTSTTHRSLTPSTEHITAPSGPRGTILRLPHRATRLNPPTPNNNPPPPLRIPPHPIIPPF